MYLLYIDESGGAEHENFVLAGLAAFEGELRKHAEFVDGLMEKYFPGSGLAEKLRTTSLRSIAWKEQDPNFGKPELYALCREVSEHLYSVGNEYRLILFGNVIHIPSISPRDDPYILAFEGIVKRVDTYRVKRHKAGDTHKGLIIVESSSERRSNQMREVVTEFRTEGTKWGKLHNLPEIPLFARKRDSRLLQLADFVSHATFRRYEFSHGREFDRIVTCFDKDQGSFTAPPA